MAASPAPGNWVDMTDTQGGVVTYRIRFTSPGASSPTFPLAASSQITSVTYSGTGVYTIVLGSQFYQVLTTACSVKQASYSASGACGARWTSDAPTTATVVLTTETAAGAAVATASNDVVTFTIVVQNFRSPGNS